MTPANEATPEEEAAAAAEEERRDALTDDERQAEDEAKATADAEAEAAKKKPKTRTKKTGDAGGDDGLEERVSAAVAKAMEAATGSLPSADDLAAKVQEVLMSEEHRKEHERLAALASGGDHREGGPAQKAVGGVAKFFADLLFRGQ